MPTNQIILSLLILAAVLFAIARQVLPRRVRRLQFLLVPIIAAYEAYHSLPQPGIPGDQLFECLLTVLAALTAGTLQAFSTSVFDKDGLLYTRGGWTSLVIWIGLIIVRTVIGLLFQGQGYFTQMHNVQWIMWTAAAVTFGSRSLILYLRHPEIRQALFNERSERTARRNL